MDNLRRKTIYQSFEDHGHRGFSKSREKFDRLNLPTVVDKNVLDVGCNAGYFCIKLSEKGAKCDALDINPKNIDLAEEWATVYNCKNINFHAVDFFDFEGSKKYDIVICLSTFHFLLDKQQDFFKKVSDLIAPSGLLVLEASLSQSNQESDNFVEAFRRKWDKIPYNFPNKKTLIKYAENQGFMVKSFGKSVNQAGDPIPRFIFHFVRKSNFLSLNNAMKELIVLVPPQKAGHHVSTYIFADISKSLGLHYYDLSFNLRMPNDADVILFEVNAEQDFQYCETVLAIQKYKIKGIHMVRNPFEFITSSYNFFRNQPISHWKAAYDKGHPLRKVREIISETYARVLQLQSLDTDEGLAFEINNISKKIIMDVYAWDYSDDRFLNIKLEDFYDDFDKTVGLAAEFLGLDVSKSIGIARKHDIHRMDKLPHWVTNLTGKKYRYPDFFKEKHYDQFYKIFPPDIFTKLGYDAKDQDPKTCNIQEK